MLQIGKSTRPRLRDIGALTDRVTAWSLRHRTLAVAGWLAFVAAAVLAGALMPTDGARATDPGDSGRAQRALRAQPVEAPILENVLVERAAPGGPRLAGDPGARAAVADLVASLRRAPGVAVRSPYEPGARDLLSADGRSGLVTIQVSGPADGLRSRSDRAQATIRTVAARHPGIRLDQAGDRSLSVSVDQGIKADLRHAELISLPLTVAVLLLIFGSAVAAALPLLLAATAVLGAFGLLQVVAYWVPVNSASSAMVLLIGVAVGVDYALFYVRRVREERTAGRPTGAALLTATRTSGHVIVVSGVTVMLCLTGLVLTGLDNFRGVAAGTVLVVGMAMAGSVTALPGLLALLGDRVNAGRLPWLGRRRQAATGSRAWAALARSGGRRPRAG
ncbi:MAG TPA: MMPL family transporter, partial [Pilimelia sp.]|nr:MMPL family transporter [Pilimelia sp.]